VRVLHLPCNIASQISVLVRSLRDIGIDARGLVLNNELEQDVTGCRSITLGTKRCPVRWMGQFAECSAAVLSSLVWADVVHYHFAPCKPFRGLDLRLCDTLKRVRVVQFWGSDIRNGEVAEKMNPYWHRLPEDYRSRQTAEQSRRRQECFARRGFHCVSSAWSLDQHVFPDLFPIVHRIPQAVQLDAFLPTYPDPDEKRPRVIHFPSVPALKGTSFITAAAERLAKQYDFEFQLVTGKPREEALAAVAEADVVVDQLLSGGHGLAALEAMALGKPVICYLTPKAAQNYPQDIPIINANPDTIEERLAEIVADGPRRHELGRQGRRYVERHHDAAMIARKLVDLYESLR